MLVTHFFSLDPVPTWGQGNQLVMNGGLSRKNSSLVQLTRPGCGSGPGQGAGLPGPRKGQLFDAGYHVLEYLVQSYCLMKGWKDLGPKACNELREATSQSPAPQEDEPMAGLYIS